MPAATWSSAAACCVSRSWNCISAWERSAASDRQLFYISGGLLARKTEQPTRSPRLEFREVLNGSAALVAIHDYRPTLPWPLYNLTQARAHLWVMRNFARAVGSDRT